MHGPLNVKLNILLFLSARKISFLLLIKTVNIELYRYPKLFYT
jgi:hypothetical protein